MNRPLDLEGQKILDAFLRSADDADSLAVITWLDQALRDPASVRRDEIEEDRTGTNPGSGGGGGSNVRYLLSRIEETDVWVQWWYGPQSDYLRLIKIGRLPLE